MENMYKTIASPEGGIQVPMTEEEIAQRLSEEEVWISEQKATEYARNRVAAYPEIGEQLDMLWHDLNNGRNGKDSLWFQAIEEIKVANPKP